MLTRRTTPTLVARLLVAGFALGGPLIAQAASPNLDLARQLNQSFIEVAERVSPAVVVVTVREKPEPFLDSPGENGGDDSMDGLPPGFWRRFHRQFEDQMPERPQGQGSGVIVRKNGYILTNRHVIEDAEKIQVRLLDGRTFDATVRGIDPPSDIAVIKIEADDLPVVALADSSTTRVGEFAIAIGAPFNLDYSVTVGHVSAKGRSNVVPGSEGASMDQDFLQTDANINPGNSGGPLVNLEGQVIGINTLIHGLRSGIGFAIPSNLAREVSDELIERGKFTRAWLGVSIRAVKDDPEYRALVPGVPEGVIVQAILPNGPAAKADLHPADVITRVDGKAVATPQDLRNEVRGKKLDHPIALEVFRAGRSLRVNVSPAEYVETVAAPNRSAEVRTNRPPEGLGIRVDRLTPDVADQFGVSVTEGVIVTSVDRDSPAARKGIKPGDIITSLQTFGRKPRAVATPADFSGILKGADLTKGVIVDLISGDTARFEILKAGSD